jgi:nitroreductase
VDVFDAVRTVLAVRRYRDRPVPEDVIERIVESARLTASAANGQPWHFIVVRNPETLRELGKAVRSGPYIGGAAFAVAVAVERTRLAESDASRAGPTGQGSAGWTGSPLSSASRTSTRSSPWFRSGIRTRTVDEVSRPGSRGTRW